MKYNRRDNYEEKARQYLRDIDDAYILNQSGTLYEPKAEDTQDQRSQNSAGANRDSPFHVSILRDWIPIIVSALTFLLLCGTVYYAHKQWWEAQRTADASANTFCEIQKQTTLLRQQMIGTQAAYFQIQPAFQHDSHSAGFTGYQIIAEFQNGGKVYASDFEASITLSEINVPKFTVIGKPKRVRINRKIFAPHDPTRFGFYSVDDATFDLADFTESEMDQFRKLHRTFEIAAVYSYDDGFGERVTNTVCRSFVYIPVTSQSGMEAWPECDEGRRQLTTLSLKYATGPN